MNFCEIFLISDKREYECASFTHIDNVMHCNYRACIAEPLPADIFGDGKMIVACFCIQQLNMF